MPNASISGLASGLDTETIINQLMQLEAAPQTQLKNNLSSERSSLTFLQNINAKVASLTIRAGDLAKASAWASLTATSSSDKVSVAATDGATTGTFSFTVVQTATAHQLSFGTKAALTDVVTGGSTVVRLDMLDGTTRNIDTVDGTLSGLVKAINDADAGIRASTIKTADGNYRLQVESTTTGAASDFTLTNLDGAGLLGGTDPINGGVMVQGQDAAVTIGINSDRVTSSTDTFTALMPGVDVTLASDVVTGTAATVTIGRDSTPVATLVNSLVDAINSALSDIAAASDYNTTTKKSGPLAGENSLQSLRNRLLDSIYPGDGTSLASLGLEVDRSGKITFDKTKFSAAYGADPTGVAAKFAASDTTQGFAARVQSIATAASDSTTGTLTSVLTGRNSTIGRLQDSIDAWDLRLELRRTTLTRQYTALEVALSNMQAQSSWLAGQIASLPTMSSNGS